MEPTEEDMRRDLAADVKVCEASTPGDWFAWVYDRPPASRGGEPYGGVQGPRRVSVDKSLLFAPADATFIALAHDGWPAALRLLAHERARAEALSAENDALRAEVQRLKDEKCVHDLAKEWHESALTPHFPDEEEGDVK